MIMSMHFIFLFNYFHRELLPMSSCSDTRSCLRLNLFKFVRKQQFFVQANPHEFPMKLANFSIESNKKLQLQMQNSTFSKSWIRLCLYIQWKDSLETHNL